MASGYDDSPVSVTALTSAEIPLPGVTIPEPPFAQIRRGGGIELAREPAAGLARVSRVHAFHVFPLGAEAATREIAAGFRVTRGINSRRR